MKRAIIFSVAMMLLGALIWLLMSKFPKVMHNDQNIISIITTMLVLTALLARMVATNANLSLFLKQIGIWILIGLIVLTGYSYQDDMKNFGNRLMANLVPGYGQSNDDGSVVFYAGNAGHFLISANINEVAKINFLFDTGASMIALTPEDATKIGIDIKALKYNSPLSTANGIAMGAEIVLDKVQIGAITMRNITAMVASGGLDTSLLGMSFLRRLKQFDIHDNILTLTN